MHRAARSEQLAAWAVIDIPCRIKAEVGTREGAVLPVRPVKHRDMWCDALLFDKPVQHRSRTVSGIARKPFRLETKALLCSIDHGPSGADLSLANGAGCLNVNDDAKLHVDEVVVGVSKKCRSFVRSGPLCRGIGWRDELRDHVAGRAPCLVVEGRQILLHGAAGPSRIAIPLPILTCDRALLVGIGLYQARIDGKAFTPQCTSRPPVRTHDGKRLPRGSARCGRVKMPNDLG